MNLPNRTNLLPNCDNPVGMVSSAEYYSLFLLLSQPSQPSYQERIANRVVEKGKRVGTPVEMVGLVGINYAGSPTNKPAQQCWSRLGEVKQESGQLDSLAQNDKLTPALNLRGGGRL